MPVDTSIYSQLKSPEPINLLGMTGQFAQIQNAMNQNRLFQQDYAGKQAMGRAFQAALQSDGSIDWGKAVTNMALDPQGAWMAPQLASEVAQRQLTQQQTLAASLANAHTKYSNYADATASLLTQAQSEFARGERSSPDVKQGDVIAKLAEMQGAGLIDKDTLLPILQALPSDGPKLTDWLRGVSASSTTATGNLEKTLGAIGYQNVGGQLVPTQTSSLMHTATPLPGAIGTSMTPGERNTPVQTGTNPAGQPTFHTKGQIAAGQAAGLNSGSGGASGGNALMAPPAAVPAGGNMLAPTPAVRPASAAVGQQQQQTGAVGLSPFQEARQKDIADYAKNLDDRVLNESSLAKNIDEVRQQMQKTSTGGGTEFRLAVAQAMQAFGVDPELVDKVAGGGIAPAQVIGKLSVQDAMAQLKAQLTGVGGSRMNAQEFVAYVKNNPNLLTDPRAANDIFNLWNQFYEKDKAEQAGLTQHITSGKDPNSWPSTWANSEYMKKFSPDKQLGEWSTEKAGSQPSSNAGKNWIRKNGSLQLVPQ